MAATQPSFIGSMPRSLALGLNETYIFRPGFNARSFFIVGQVFAMLYTEVAGAQSVQNVNDEAYSYVRFQEAVYSQIRRFIIAEVRRGFVYACVISTYRNRGTNKPGAVPSEHAIAYFPGTDPRYCYFEGEYDNVMRKEAIEIIPVDDEVKVKAESRIRFSKAYPVEMNVRVKDIGRVSPQHLDRFLEYYSEYRY